MVPYEFNRRWRLTTPGIVVVTEAVWPGERRANEPVSKGVPPSICVPVGGAMYRSDSGRLATALSEMVVKPVVGAGAGCTARAAARAIDAIPRARQAHDPTTHRTASNSSGGHFTSAILQD